MPGGSDCTFGNYKWSNQIQNTLTHNMKIISCRPGYQKLRTFPFYKFGPKVQNFRPPKKFSLKTLKNQAIWCIFALNRPKVVSSFLSRSPVWPNNSQKPHQKSLRGDQVSLFSLKNVSKMLFFQLFIIKYHPEDNKCIKTLQVCFLDKIEDLEESTTFTTLVGPAQNNK